MSVSIKQETGRSKITPTPTARI